MVLNKLIQIKVSTQLYEELLKESLLAGLTVSQACRLRLSNRKIIDRNELEKEDKPKFRPIQSFGN